MGKNKGIRNGLQCLYRTLRGRKNTLGEILTRYLVEFSVHNLGFKPEQSRIKGLLNNLMENVRCSIKFRSWLDSI